MERTTPTVVVATLGGKPQVVTLLLDALRARGVAFDRVHVIMLALANERYRSALERLTNELRGGHYRGAPCSLLTEIVRGAGREVAAMADDDAVDAARATFDDLFKRLKHQEWTIHLGLSGGPRLLGYLGLAMAQQYFTEHDRVWHLHSSEAARALTDDGRTLHLPDDAGLSLLRVPMPPGHEIVRMVRQRYLAPDAAERRRCQAVWDQLSAQQRAVLRVVTDGLRPAAAAAALELQRVTFDSHQSVILRLCRDVWPDEFQRANERHARIGYQWLGDRFREFVRSLGPPPPGN